VTTTVPEVDITGNWPILQSTANLRGTCGDGESTLELWAYFQNLEAGQALQVVTWSLTVPDTYTAGGASGSPILPGDLDVVFLGWSASVQRDERGNPAIWPGEFP
jgi:hypothetical protein